MKTTMLAALLLSISTAALADSLRSDKHLVKIDPQTQSANSRQYHVQIFDAETRIEITQLKVVATANTVADAETTAGATRYQVRVIPHGEAYLIEFTANDGAEVIDTMRGGFTAAAKSRPAPIAAKRAGRDIPEPTVIRRVDAVYTEEARAAGAAGSVVVELLIDKSGFVRDATVVQSMGLGLDESAVDALKQWQFAPSVQGRVPVEVAYEVRVEFRP